MTMNVEFAIEFLNRSFSVQLDNFKISGLKVLNTKTTKVRVMLIKPNMSGFSYVYSYLANYGRVDN